MVSSRHIAEIETWCIAPKGEAPESRRARIRKYEDFFFPASLAVPDDVRAMEGVHTGSEALNNGWNDLALGHKTLVDGADAAGKVMARGGRYLGEEDYVGGGIFSAVDDEDEVYF